MQQMAALQASTAMHLLHAGANMLLMQSGMLAAAAPRLVPMTTAVRACFHRCRRVPAEQSPSRFRRPVDDVRPAQPQVAPVKPIAAGRSPSGRITSAAIVLPKSVTVAPDKANVAVRTVTLGGSGTRTSSVDRRRRRGAAVPPLRRQRRATSR